MDLNHWVSAWLYCLAFLHIEQRLCHGGVKHFSDALHCVDNNHVHTLRNNVHGFIAETTEKAADDFYVPQAEVMNRIGRERGWGPTSRAHFDQARGPNGALFVGNPEQVAQKIVAQHKTFGNDRFLLQMAIGTMPHAKIMKAIELYGSKVAPMVRKETAKTTPAAAAPVA